ncbi:MAG: hypothetical protein O2798_00275 [Chloroflexi bacterium]|nr:hypothetical protein [Chloroflexota bacterium]MDA1239259.1 hypothetical protein [Chloroflexota bacterium]
MSRDFGRPTSNSRTTGDQLVDAPDATRPANPWPRLLAFFAGVVAAVILAGVCVVALATPPAREIKVEVGTVDPQVPRFIPITIWGADRNHFTFGVFLSLDANGNPRAVLSRDPESGCNLVWDGAAEGGGVTGLYVDRCSESRYTPAGVALHEGAQRDLHRFAAEQREAEYVVSVSRYLLAACRAEGAVACAPDGALIDRKMPSGFLPPDFASR